jgi:hypothetical protein
MSTLAAATNWSLRVMKATGSITRRGPGPVTKLQQQCADSGDDRMPSVFVSLTVLLPFFPYIYLYFPFDFPFSVSSDSSALCFFLSILLFRPHYNG